MVNIIMFIIVLIGTTELFFGSFNLLPAFIGATAYWTAILLQAPEPISVTMFITITIIGYITLFTYNKKTDREPTRFNAQRLIGMETIAGKSFHNDGWIDVGGETWKATSNQKIEAGQNIKIIEVNGNILKVESSQ